MINVGVVGYGYWGPNLVRNFSDSDSARVLGVSDLHADRLAAAERRCPGVKTLRDYQELIHDPQIDAVAVATPVSTHFPIALEALRAGKHVLLEKPFTATSEQARRLIEEAERRRLVLMVDHTFVYTQAVQKIRELVARGDLGETYYYDSVRVNLGLFQQDVDVIWDLAVHDFSIMDYVLAAQPVAVSATGISHVSGGQENVAYITAFFPGNLLGHIHVNWLAPVKVRRTLIGGSRKMIIYDDLEPSEKVKVYDKGVDFNVNPESVYQMRISYRSGDMWAPQLPNSEALRTEIQHFLHCVEHCEKPMTDGESGLRVVKILEAATQSMKGRGKLVETDVRSAIA